MDTTTKTKTAPIRLKYGSGEVTFQVPERALLDNLAPQSQGLPALTDREIAAEIRQALEGQRAALSRNSRVLILVDDQTRETPQHRILPPILNSLHDMGIPRDGIRFVLAKGTHDTPPADVMRSRFTAEIVDSFEWIIPDISDPDAYFPVGRDAAGHELRVHRALADADYAIGTGMVVPHGIAGYSGGAKIVMPGCASPHSVGRNHMSASEHPDLYSLLGNPENPLRLQMESVAELAGLKFIVNTVLSERQDVVGVFCGDLRLAHRKACALAAGIFRPAVREQADLVIASAHPCESDYWQCIKSLINANAAVKPGGRILLIAECPLGLFGNASRYAACFRYASSDCGTIQAHAAEFDDLVGVSNIMIHATILKRARLAFLSRNLSREETATLGADLFESLEEVQKEIDRLAADGGTVTTLDYGGWTSPVFQPLG